MQTEIKPYSRRNLDRLNNILRYMADSGTPQFYEILVDGVPVVSKTNNPNEFRGYRSFMDDESETVQVNIYQDGNKSEHVFEIQKYQEQKQAPAVQNTGLSGAELENKINQTVNNRLTQERLKWDHEQLRKEYENLKKELRDSENYIDQLESGIKALKEKKNKIGDVHVGELLSIMVESMIRRNKHNLDKVPGGAMLAGLLGNEESPALEEKKEEKKPDPGSVLTEEDKACLHTGKILYQQFTTAEERAGVGKILHNLHQDKTMIPVVIELTNEKLSKEKK